MSSTGLDHSSGFITARGSELVPTPASEPMEPAWQLPGLRVVVLSVIALGAVFGSLDVTVVAFAQVHSAPAAAGPLLALIAFDSMLGGLWYGTRRWRIEQAARYLLSLAVLTGGALLSLAADHVLTMAPVDLILGLAIAPSLIASSSLVVSTVRATGLTEGLAWQSAGINIGAAAGAALAGRLVDAGGIRVGLLLPPSAAAAAAAAVAVGWWSGRNPRPGHRLWGTR